MKDALKKVFIDYRFLFLFAGLTKMRCNAEIFFADFSVCFVITDIAYRKSKIMQPSNCLLLKVIVCVDDELTETLYVKKFF